MSLKTIRTLADNAYEITVIDNGEAHAYTLPASDPEGLSDQWVKKLGAVTQRDLNLARRFIWAFHRASYPMPASSSSAIDVHELEKSVADAKRIIDKQQGYGSTAAESFKIKVIENHPWRVEIHLTDGDT